MRENFRTAIYSIITWVAILFVLTIALCLSYRCNPYPVKGHHKPPSTLKESDLVGTWQANYGGARIDTITLRADGTYKQVFRQADGYTYESPWNRWYLEYRPSGWIYIHLEGMRYYLGGIEMGESGGRRPTTAPGRGLGSSVPFYDFGEDRSITMLDKVILRVASSDFDEPRGIVLKHMSTSVDAAVGVIFTLCRKCDQATPAAQTEDLPCCQEDFEIPAELKNCWVLLIAEDYDLVIFRDDGMHWADLSKADGQIFVPFITRYAIKDNIMVGEKRSQSNPELWFWFNLDTRESDLLFTKSEYLAALKKLGFAEEPELHPVEFYCEKGDCRPCFGWSPGPTTTPTLSPSPTATSTLTPTPEPTPTIVPPRPLPKPRFSAAPTGTILVTQYRYFRPSEIPSYDDASRPYYFPRDSIVWAIPAEGEPYRWLDDGRDKVEMRVSPDGSQVAYVVNSRDGKFTSVWVVNADGSNPRQLTPDYPDDDFGGHVYLGGWSPDGQKLAYIFNDRKGWGGAMLYVVDVTGEKVTHMNIERVYDAGWVNNRLLRVARDPNEIAEIDIYTQEVTFLEEPPPVLVSGGAVEYDQTLGSESITVYTADGSELYQLDLSGWPIWHSTLSPDLKWFVINVSGIDTKTTGIYKVGKDQSHPQLMLQGFGFSYETEIVKINKDTNLYLSRVWSPDSQWFLVLKFHNENDRNELCAVNVETGEIRTVIEYEATGVEPMVWLK